MTRLVTHPIVRFLARRLAYSAVVMACMFAAFIPSWRSARVDPTIAFRQE